jgi:hypothetical protein
VPMANPEHLKILERGREAWNEWRRKSPKIRPDLSGVKCGPTPSLIRINLSYADLTDAVFIGSNLLDATLKGANLHDAYLDRVYCAGTDFSDAKLTHTALYGPTLHQAILNNTDFMKATLSFTSFADVDLSSARGLETVRHHGPSTIGIDTIYASKGRIPREFLIGAGLPNKFIEYAESLIGQPIQFYSCFISYSHADKPFAQRLHDTLQATGIRCWLDEKQLLPGDDIYEHVDRGIRLWDKVLLCCSKDSLTSWWVDAEIGKAFAKEQQIMKDRGKKVLALIPLNLDGHLFKWSDGKADEIRRRFAPDFTGWQNDPIKVDAQIDRVIKALHAGGAAREKPPEPRL